MGTTETDCSGAREVIEVACADAFMTMKFTQFMKLYEVALKVSAAWDSWIEADDWDDREFYELTQALSQMDEVLGVNQGDFDIETWGCQPKPASKRVS